MLSDCLASAVMSNGGVGNGGLLMGNGTRRPRSESAPVYGAGGSGRPFVFVRQDHTWASSRSPGEGVQFFFSRGGADFSKQGGAGGLGPFKNFLSNFMG